MDKAHDICTEMMEQRGYKMGVKESNRVLASNDEETVCIFYLDGQFGNDSMKDCMSAMNKISITHCIVVVGDTITNPAKTAIGNLDKGHGGIIFELFISNELQANITKHRLQPKRFTKLSTTDAADFIKKYSRKIPRMKVSDPIARFYHYRGGDIIEVERQNGYVTYRIVV